MNAIFTILTVLVIIAAILLTIVVLLQNGKGGGLASNFVAGNQTFGVRQTADILEKITWVLVAIVLVLSIASAFTTGSSNKEEIDVTEQVINSEEQALPDFTQAQPMQSAEPVAEPTE